MREGMRLYRERDLEGAIRPAPPARPETHGAVLQRRVLPGPQPARRAPLRRGHPSPAQGRRDGAHPADPSGLAAAPIYAYLVEAYAGAGQTKAAMDTLEQALQVPPRTPSCCEPWAGSSFSRGSCPSAGRAREGAIDRPRRGPPPRRAVERLSEPGRPHAGPGRGARGAATRPELARGPPRARPGAGRGRARGRGGRGVAGGAAPLALPPGRALLPRDPWSCARGAPRRRCRC